MEKIISKFYGGFKEDQPKIMLTYIFNKTCALYLDLDVHITGGKLTSDLFV